MDSSSQGDSSFFFEGEELEMLNLVDGELKAQLQAFRTALQGAYEESRSLRDLCETQKRRIDQLEEETESLRRDIQDLNLLDGFLRSGIAKTLSLQDDSELQGMLREFLGRTLQTTLTRGATQFQSSRSRKENDS